MVIRARPTLIRFSTNVLEAPLNNKQLHSLRLWGKVYCRILGVCLPVLQSYAIKSQRIP